MAPVDSRDYVLSGIYYSILEPRRCAKHNVACQQLLRPITRWSGSAYCWRRVQADIDPMSVKCWASVAGAGQYPFSPSQYFMLAVPARCFKPNLHDSNPWTDGQK